MYTTLFANKKNCLLLIATYQCFKITVVLNIWTNHDDPHKDLYVVVCSSQRMHWIESPGHELNGRSPIHNKIINFPKSNTQSKRISGVVLSWKSIYLWPVPEQSPLLGRWLSQWPHRRPSGLHPPRPWAPCWVRSDGAGCGVFAPTLLKAPVVQGSWSPSGYFTWEETQGKTGSC